MTRFIGDYAVIGVGKVGGIVGGRAGITIALAFSLLMNLGAWWFSDKIVLTMTGAREISPAEDPVLHRIVEDLASSAGIPKPRVYYVPDATPNAFATGRGPGHAAVAVTQGLLNLLNEREIRGVLSHEIAHIRNRDVLISSVAAAIAGAIMWLAAMARWAAIFGGFGRDDDDGYGGIFELLLIAILAPIAALIIQMAISRSREYKADVAGAQISRDPNALADALEKLAAGVKFRPLRDARAAAVHYIVHPAVGGFASLFSTHPPIEKRVARLRAMAKELGYRRVFR